MVRERSQLGLDGIGHMVEILAHGKGIHMVKYGPCRSRSSVYHACEGFELHHRIELPLPFRNIHLDYPVLHLVGDVDSLGKVVDRVRCQKQGNQVRSPADIDFGHPRIQCAIDIEQGHVQCLSARNRPCVCQKHFRPFFAGKRLRPERPTGTDDQVTGHSNPGSFIEHYLEHIDPLVA